MKHKLSILAILLMAMALPQNVRAYDFSAVAPSGQTLYYSFWVYDESGEGIVHVIYPNSSATTASDTWTGYTKPTGDLVIPSTVTYNGFTFTVSMIGTAFYQCTGLTSVTIPNSVETISRNCFYGCTGLTSITIPNSVTSIGFGAFGSCSGLTSVTFNATNCTSMGGIYDSNYYYVFSNCPNITSLTIGENVTNIPFSAFYGCSGLTSVTFNATNCTTVHSQYQHNDSYYSGGYAFAACHNLTSLTIGENVTNIPSGTFYGCTGLTSVTIPNSVTNIGEYAFGACSGLTSITVSTGNTVYDSRDNCNAIIERTTNTLISGCMTTVIPNSVTSIGDYAFCGYSGLASVTIPNSVTSIGNGAFCYCSGLTSVTIPNSVTSIGGSAFWQCYGLTSVTIPNSVTSIGNGAFSYCSGLTSVTIPNSVTSIGVEAFYSCSGLTSATFNATNCTTDGRIFYHCPNLTSLTIGDNVTNIPSGAFSNCSGLTSVTIPNSVTSIGDAAFRDCSGLTSVTFNATNCTTMGSSSSSVFSDCPNLTSLTVGDNVTNIPSYAFYNCRGLTSVIIGSGVNSIGEYAFAGGEHILQMTCRATVPPTVANVNAFDEVFKGIPLYVPPASLSSYQVAYAWREFTNFLPLSTEGIDGIEAVNAKVYAEHGRIVVEGVEGETVSVFDVAGRQVKNSDLPASVYMVKIGSAPARKVVVTR